MTAIQESLWMDQLSLLMQLAGAVADLIDIQGSSVLVCLENGWDTTAQVHVHVQTLACLLYTSPSPRDATLSRMPSSA